MITFVDDKEAASLGESKPQVYITIGYIGT